jgi:predicted Zn-dependent protease
MRASILVGILALLGGCVTRPAPEPKPPIAVLPAAIPEGPVDVWLMPLDGFPRAMVTSLARRFSSELHINVRASTHAGTNRQMYSASGQMISEQVVRELSLAISRLYDTTPKTAYIILTSADLNGADGTTRFVFSTHFPGRISVVSAARLSDAFFGRPERQQITEERLYKIVKKSIGLQYYELPRSTKMQSVMYSPIMSLDDLDAVGTTF